MQKKRTDIQVLRGLAVTAVVLFHANEKIFPTGFVGVDVFFVVSGFVVTPLILRILENQEFKHGIRKDLFTFYRRRFYRLAPALSVTLTISTVLIFLLGPPGDHQRIARQGIATLFILGNMGAYTYGGDYFSPNPIPFLHTWSLSVEEQIYLFLPLLLIAVQLVKKNSRKALISAMIVIAILSFLSFLFPQALHPLYSMFGIQLSSQFSFYSPLDRIWEFLIGSFAYFLQKRLGFVVPRFRKFALLALFFSLFSPIPVASKTVSIIVIFLATYVILTKSLNDLPKQVTAKFGWVGDRSYSIYLIHLPMIYLAQYSALTGTEINSNRGVQTAVAVLATLFLSSMCYSQIENKFRSFWTEPKIAVTIPFHHTLLFLITPVFVLSTMNIGFERQYWGLNQNISVQSEKLIKSTESCKVDSIGTPACKIFVKGAKNTVVLIGDSHAGHLTDALINSAKMSNLNVVIWWHGGCPFQLEEKRYSQITLSCVKKNLETLQWISRNRPFSVIVSQYVHQSSSQISLRRALRELTKLTPNVLLIGNNPIFPDKNLYMVSRPIILSAYIPPKTFQLNQMDRTDKDASERLINWSQRNNIRTLDIESLFCNSTECSRFSKEGWLYRDVDHLTFVGAKRLEPEFRDYFQSL